MLAIHSVFQPPIITIMLKSQLEKPNETNGVSLKRVFAVAVACAILGAAQLLAGKMRSIAPGTQLAKRKRADVAEAMATMKQGTRTDLTSSDVKLPSSIDAAAALVGVNKQSVHRMRHAPRRRPNDKRPPGRALASASSCARAAGLTCRSEIRVLGKSLETLPETLSQLSAGVGFTGLLGGASDLQRRPRCIAGTVGASPDFSQLPGSDSQLSAACRVSANRGRKTDRFPVLLRLKGERHHD
jgi:hypothetical protein